MKKIIIMLILLLVCFVPALAENTPEVIVDPSVKNVPNYIIDEIITEHPNAGVYLLPPLAVSPLVTIKVRLFLQRIL